MLPFHARCAEIAASRLALGRSVTLSAVALSAVILSAVALSACSGSISDAPSSGGPREVDTAPSDVRPAPSGRFSRLTHQQWENSVRDLLLLNEASGLSQAFPADARTAGFLFDNHMTSLETDQVLSAAYANAAEALAERVSTNSAQLARLLPPDAGGDRERARAFISSFGERAFRRPLSNPEIDNLLELYDAGTTLYDDQSGFVAGIRVLIEAFLQSPHFLYRIEASTERAGASIPLGDWEMGQRLSFLLTNTTPDTPLLAAARAGQLSTPDQVRAQATRLLSTPGARPAVVGFHDQLLEFEKYASIQPSPSAYPGVSDSFGASALDSSRSFIEELAFVEQGTFKDLMTSTRAFVNRDLASAYGVTGSFGTNLVGVDLPAGQRRGILNQIGFLAANATSVQPDPIHRGVFVATRVLCRTIAAPPDGVPPLPPVVDGTNREVVEKHTESSPVCRACHETQINPFGFPFENYDATGAYRSMDNGHPVDARTTPRLDGAELEVDNSLELADALSESPEAHECFVSHLLEYAFGRERGPLDEGLVAELTQASLSDTPIVDLMVRIATSAAFMTRSTEELP